MWVEVLVLSLLIYKSESATQAAQLSQCSGACKQKGICQTDDHGKEVCVECYPNFYENPSKGCEEMDYCTFLENQCQPNGVCVQMWGNGFCKCNPPYFGRFCSKEDSSVTQMSRPEILFNLEPQREKTTVVLLYFDGSVGTTFSYDITVASSKFFGQEDTLKEAVPAEVIKNTDLASVQPLQNKIPTVRKKLILLNVNTPSEPSWQVSVTLSNAGVIQYQYTYTVSMYGPKYCTPKVLIRDCSTTKETPTIKLRNERFLFRSSIFPGCGKTSSGSSQLIVTWHLHRLSKEYPTTSNLNEVNTANKGNMTHYDLPPFSLIYGLYGLKMNVEEIPARPTNKQRGSKLFACWVMIQPKPLTAAIADGTEKEVGTQQVTTIDASESVDENEPTGTDMNYLIFSWTCNPPLPTTVIDFASFHENSVMLGPGKLSPGTYNFTVKVSVDLEKAPTKGTYPIADTVPGSSSAGQVVHVVGGKTVLLSISCVKNCGKPETINLQEIIYFTVKCLALCEGSNAKGYYHWTANNNLHFDTSTTEYGDDTDRLIIKGNVIRPGITYTITVSASPPGLLKARAVTTLKANVPMVLAAGKCTVSPNEGLSGKTRFNIKCNYPITYLGLPLRYKIFQRTTYNDPESEVMVSYGYSPNQTDLLLSPGDPNDHFKTYLSVQAEDCNNLQYRRENATSTQVKRLFDDPQIDINKEIPNILEEAAEQAENKNIQELLAVITSTKSSMDASPNKSAAVQSEVRSKFVDYIDAIPLLNHRIATQALMALHNVLDAGKGDEAKPVDHDTIEVAASLLKKISSKLFEGVDSSEGVTSQDLQKAAQFMEESTNILMSGMDNSLKDFDAVNPEGVPPLEPTDKETGMDYSAYSDLDPDYLKNKKSYEKASMSILSAMDDFANAVGGSMAPGEKEIITKSPNMTTYIKVEKPELLAGQLLSAGNNEGVFISTELGKLIQKEVDYIEIHITVSDKNPFAWDPESRDINTKLLIVTVINRLTGKEVEWKWKKPAQLFISSVTVKGNQTVLSSNANFSSPETVTGNVSVPVHSKDDPKVLTDQMKVYKVRAKKGLKPYLMFEQPSHKLKVAVGVNLRPSLKDMQIYSQIIANTVMVEGVALTDHEYFYISILPHESSLQDAAQLGIDTLTVPFRFLVLLVGCRSWNILKMRWNSDGCEAGPQTTPDLLHCNCIHLSAFMGSIFVVAVQAEDMQDVNVNLLFGRSYIICKFVMIILLLSLLPLLFVFWLDRRSKARYKAMLVILDSNVPGEQYAYLIGVYTGNVPDSASTCNVSFQMYGEKGISKAHLLSDVRRDYVWSRNSDNWFVVYTSSWLGDLRSISVWHDSSGHDPTWYCEKILVHDIKRNEVWVFLVQRYISVLYGDGTIFCSKEPATRKQIIHRKLLFKDHWNICLREEHMWLSVFRRHPRSKYTRTERLAVCICYTMLCMLISVIMYGIPYKNPAEQITVSAAEGIGTELCVVVFTNLLAIPLVLPLILLFRKTRPKQKELDAEDDTVNCICCPYMKTLTSCKLPSPDVSSSQEMHTCDEEHETCRKRCEVCCRRHTAGKCCVSTDDTRKIHHSSHAPRTSQQHQREQTPSDAREKHQQLKVSASLQVKFREAKSGRIYYYKATFREPPLMDDKRKQDAQPDDVDGSFNKVPPRLTQPPTPVDQENKSFTHEVIQTPSQEKYIPSKVAITWAEYTKRKLSRAKYIFLDFIMMDPLVIEGTYRKSEFKNKENTEKLEEEDYRSTIPRYWFRHCFKYWTWLLCILIVILCALLVCTIGVQYGDIKSWRWIMMMMIILITSFIIWETLKVYLLALILARGYKVQAKHYQLYDDICWAKSGVTLKLDKRKHKHKLVTQQSLDPMPLSRLKTLRDKQSTRRNLGLLAKDIVMYGVYIILQAYIVYIIMDDKAYYSTKAVENVIIQPTTLSAVRSHSQFFNYMKVQLIPALHMTEDYNGDAFTRNGITALYDTQLLGVVLLQQARISKDACKIEPVLRDIFIRCRAEYCENTADYSNYSIKWQQFDAETFREVRSSTPWLYSKGYLQATGILHVYPASGYIVQLGRTRNNSLTVIQFLQDHEWLDSYTRAIIMRFALYNTNQNLFNIVTVIVEIDHTGVFVSSHSVNTMALLISYVHLGWFVLTIVVLWMFILALFLMQKVIQVKKVTITGYLKDFWNLVDLLIIGVAVTAVVLTLARNLQVQHLLRHLEEKDHNEYVDFSRIALWQNSLISLIGFLICVSTIRLWKVLRWNYIFRTCENALFRALKTLLSLAVFTMVAIVSFGAFSYLYIGSSDYYYRTVGQAFTTLLIAGFGFHVEAVAVLERKSFILGGTIMVLYWLIYISFWLNLFITAVMYYYTVARAYYAYLRIQYGMHTYLKEEVAYQLGRYDIEYRDEEYFANISDHVVRQPWDIEPIAIPKPTPVRLLNTLEITSTQMHIMRQTVEDYFMDSRISNMKTMLRGIIMKYGVPEDDLEPQLFHYGLEKGVPRTVPDLKLEEMYTLVNYYYYHVFSPSAATILDDAMNEILSKIDLLAESLQE